MAHRVLIRDHPRREIAITTDDVALIFKCNSSSAGNGARSGTGSQQCIVELSPLQPSLLDGFKARSSAHGILGMITLDHDVFLCVITGSSQVATVRPNETVQRIHAVDFYCLTRYDYDSPMDHNAEFSAEEFDMSSALDSRSGAPEHPFLALQKLLSGGNFYYSLDFDLTKRLQARSENGMDFDIESLDADLLWNSYMIEPLLKFRAKLSASERYALDSSHLLTSAIRGYVKTLTIPPSASPLRRVRSNYPAHLTLISRLSSRRAGTRFNARGIDDSGNVANFVETETIFWTPAGYCFSYSQVRGSLPIFWEQAAGLLPGQQKITITRPAEATQPAFDRHFENLELEYGAIHVVNLLSASKPGEAELTGRFKYHISRSPLQHGRDTGSTSSDHNLLRETEFDFHAETKGPAGYESASLIRTKIQRSADGFAYFLLDENNRDTQAQDRIDPTSRHDMVILQQEGVFRTNCLDCLDRTNLTQTIISQMALESFLRHQGESGVSGNSDFWMRHGTLWADNGDALSRIYAGTGALKTSFTRHGKMSLAGALADARKSATRLYVNNFADKGRQHTIDLLLGRLMGQEPAILFDPISDNVNADLQKRAGEYMTTKPIRILVGTFNLNGKSHGASEDLSSWLRPRVGTAQDNPEIVAVGFQEIVELSPQQIMSTDPGRRQIWEEAVRNTLNSKSADGAIDSEYILLRSGQLVGAALLVFVRKDILNDVRNVEGSVKKTGLSGMAGNKGACAIRLDYADTSICFVTAHLAAGFQNYDERNRDYDTITHGLRFPKNRSIEDHQSVIWFGDFNYRIGLENERTRRLIRDRELDTLYNNDQLNLQMLAGLAFPFYLEAPITFLPTYKYDNGSDTYDTSEKARIPAWCDRVLRKGNNLQQIDYNTAPLRFSDHRPVYAIFECTVSVVDERAREAIRSTLYDQRRRGIANKADNSLYGDSDEEDLLDMESIAPGLPPASSDRHKWWLDNGHSAQSHIQPPSITSTPNPHRPNNPFSLTEEPDWVKVPRATPTPPPPRRSATMRDQEVNRLPTKTSSVRGRRLVAPPWEGSTGRLNGASVLRRPDQTDASLSFGRETSDVTKSSVKKPAPPKPKKPSALASPSLSSDGPSSPTSIAGSDDTGRRSIPTPPSRRTVPGASSNAPAAIRRFPLPVQTRGGSVTNERQGSEINPSTSRPPLPPRQPTVDSLHSSPVDLLGDDGIDGAYKDLAPALRPSNVR